MRDRPVIYLGLMLFVALFTFPVWRDAAARATTKGPANLAPGCRARNSALHPPRTCGLRT